MPAPPPQAAPRASHPFEGTSEAHDRYKQWQLPQREAVEPAPLMQSPPFKGQSTYDQDFAAKPLPTMPAPPPQAAPRASHPFEGTSEAHDRYKQWQLPQREAVEPAPLMQSPPFKGQSTYDQDFAAKPLPAMPAPPPQAAPRASHPFEGTSEAHDRYKQWQLPEREVAAPGAWVPSTAEFYANTTSGDAFQGWKLPDPRPSIGLQLVGSQFYRLIPKNWVAPCMVSVIVTTVTENQGHVRVKVRQGESSNAEANRLLGSFDLVGIDPDSCLLYTSPSPRDRTRSRMPSSA
eukprot:TRINITY_DN8574_c0_g1_i2.p1 TRINITY_DN8574_c0_g1~~TRINITY_DN8574_c0_g1_i2.p1  ORF type:complete len:290 (+),score=63.40 TRINITY_DN8574_c0_g1_i2:3-872(+)